MPAHFNNSDVSTQPTPTEIVEERTHSSVTKNDNGTLTYQSGHTDTTFTVDEKDMSPGTYDKPTEFDTVSPFYKQEVFDKIKEVASHVAYMQEQNYHILAELAMTKSQFGMSYAASTDNNYFEIEAEEWEDGDSVNVEGMDDNGGYITYTVKYRIYASMEDSMTDFARICSSLGITSQTTDVDALDILVQAGYVDKLNVSKYLSDMRIYFVNE